MTSKARVTKIQQTHTTEGVFLAVAQQQINRTSGRDRRTLAGDQAGPARRRAEQ